MSVFARAAGYDDVAANILKYCQANKVMNKVLYDFECNSYAASMAKQTHLAMDDLAMGASVTFPDYTPDYTMPDTGHWNNGEKHRLTLNLDDMTVSACNTFEYDLKLSQRDYVLLKRCRTYPEYTSMIARKLATTKKALLDSYAFAIATGAAGLQIGTPSAPVLNTGGSYNAMWQELIVQVLGTEQMCSLEDETPDIVVYLPLQMAAAHMQFFDEKAMCACKDGIRMGIKGYMTPYGHMVQFVHDRFLPRDPTTGNVVGLWLNRKHFGLVDQSFYEGWFPDRSDLWFEGSLLYDAFLLNCKAAGAIYTDITPQCEIVCA